MTDFRGLTWDHPRGREALQAAATRFTSDSGDTLTWDVHSLEGFESTPIADTAAVYDLIVLDHPHLGDALEHLLPLDQFFSPDELASWADGAVGPSAESYVVEGRAWALPLDAATQVSARRADLVPDAPTDWAAALELADSGVVAPSIAGPHAFLTLCSIAVSLGQEPAADPDRLLDTTESLDLLAELIAKAPQHVLGLNPIGMLEHMSAADDLGYVPLVYGYVNYSMPDRARRVTFGSPPVGSRIGSTIGGTGIAITCHATPTPALLDHLRWLMSSEAQEHFIPEHAGQPSARSAWRDSPVDTAAGGFYSETLETIEHSWVRPRFAGYIPFQSTASAMVRDGLTAGVAPVAILDDVNAAYRKAQHE